LINFFLIASGGALGAITRYIVYYYSIFFFPNFPIGTFLVNFTGSFIIGFLAGYLDNQLYNDNFIRFFIIIGFLGSFTTFSMFSLEVIELINNKKIFNALIYVILSFLLCIFGAFFGFFINRI
tara:strand:- start:149 stop:517 length:369 start_codon:yes stop_codon:yes gene_type:complete